MTFLSWVIMCYCNVSKLTDIRKLFSSMFHLINTNSGLSKKMNLVKNWLRYLLWFPQPCYLKFMQRQNCTRKYFVYPFLEIVRLKSSNVSYKYVKGNTKKNCTVLVKDLLEKKNPPFRDCKSLLMVDSSWQTSSEGCTSTTNWQPLRPTQSLRVWLCAIFSPCSSNSFQKNRHTLSKIYIKTSP